MAFTNTLSNSLIWADKGWRKFAPTGRLKQPVSDWLIHQTVSIDPQNAEGLHQMGHVQKKNQDFEGAVVSYETAIRCGRSPQSAIYHHLGIVLYLLHRYEEAEAAFKHSIKATPHAIWSYSELGHILSHLDKEAEAIDQMNRAGKILAQQLVAQGKIQPQHVSHGNTVEPAFMVIGPSKAGTTSIHKWLTQHPKVLPTVGKEIRYWCEFSDCSLEWYRSFFLPVDDGTGFIAGDLSPRTIYFPQRAAERIKSLYPNIKLIILLRDSVERAFSHHQMEIRLGVQNQAWEDVVAERLKAFSQAPTTLEEIKQGRFDNCLVGSCLLPFIQAWADVFPADQMLFVDSRALLERPQATMQTVFDYLGLEPHADISYPLLNVGSYKEKMSVETVARLKEWFAPHDKALKDFLNANAPNLIGDF